MFLPFACDQNRTGVSGIIQNKTADRVPVSIIPLIVEEMTAEKCFIAGGFFEKTRRND